MKLTKLIRSRCNKLNVHLRLGKGYMVKAPDGTLCDGYFDPPHLGLYGELVVATKRPKRAWQYTLLMSMPTCCNGSTTTPFLTVPITTAWRSRQNAKHSNSQRNLV